MESVFHHNIIVALASFCFVFLKAFQQRNVAFDHYVPVIPISMLMAACEYYIVAAVALSGYSLALVFYAGCGAGLGAMSAMYLHRHIFTRLKR